MKIILLTIGTLGDVQPFVTLGSALRQAGFDVRLATHEPFRRLADSHGLEFAPLAGDPLQWGQDGELQSLVSASSSFTGWMHKLRSLATPLMQEILESCWRACQGGEAIIYSPLAWAGYSIAEKLDIPCIAAGMQPFYPTRYFPAVWMPQNIKLGWAYNRLTHLAVLRAYWYYNMPFINSWRSTRLGLKPLPLSGPYHQQSWKEQPFLQAYSPSIVPRPLRLAASGAGYRVLVFRSC